ncbi:nicotinamidase [Patescibacteria group bacterium]
MIIVDREFFEKNQVATIDVAEQKCFTKECSDEFSVSDGESIVKELNEQAKLGTLRIASKGIPGTKDFEFLDGLHVQMYNIVIYRGAELDIHPYGVCYHDYAKRISTGVIEVLHGTDKELVIVGGLATEFCMLETIKELAVAGFMVVLNLGACRGFDPSDAIDEMKAMTNVFVIDTYRELIVN